MASATEENYLKALLKLSDESGNCSVSDLSQALNVSNPTANSMIKKLSEKKFVNYEKYKPLSLTQKGKKKAALIVRKHRLTEMYLVDCMGFGWESVHGIAEQIEHIDSEAFFNRMDEMLGHPSVDPHGSPIPDENGDFQEKEYDRLSLAMPGNEYRLASLERSSMEFLRFLNRREIKLGIIINVKSIESYDGSLVVSYGKHENETLSKTVCEKLLVEML
jgi:DtxR family Mn-dependent transcriptional regulator